MSRVSVKVSSDMKELRKFIKRLETLESYEVEAGYYDSDRHPEHDIGMASLASIQEFGGTTDSGAEIPARDFLYQSFANWSRGNKDKKLPEVAVRYLINKEPIRSVLPEIGKELTWMIRWTIDVGGDFENNSPVTISYKGFNYPLVETGYMRDNAKYKVVKKTKGG